MCTGLEIAAMAAMVGGAGMQMSAQNKAAKKANAAVLEGMRRQQKVLDDKRSLTLKNLEQYDPATRQAAQEAAATEAEQSLVGELIKAQDSGVTIPGTTGNVSNEYKTNLARAVTGEMDRASTLARLMSKFRAPTDMRFKENLNNANFATQQGGLDSTARSFAATDDALVQLAAQPDSRMMTLGSLLSAVGGAASMGAALKSAAAGGATSGAGIAGKSKPWLDITSGPRKLGLGT